MINITNDGTLDIATGRSRKDTSWKNKKTQWSAFLTRISETHRTAETYAEYLAAKKPRQDEIKDIGGFVGGYLSGGRRKSGNVIHRQLLTLDIDFGEPGIWENFTLIYGNAAAVYSTHKHTPETPRLRLIMPLSREVARDEYAAIARRIAADIDIEYFDPTTYQPERLMYWPSTSKDGVYEFQWQDGPWLDVDEVLGRYVDWKDSSEWPVSARESSVVQRIAKKQGDPLEKPGVIGAFCRTYSIHEVIETYLSDVYEPCDVENRYTYKEGSTGAGLVVYDDKYAYSHHGTDPVSGKLCNAFDLVRIHKYGLKDEDVQDGTPTVKMPSYAAMVELATGDPKVRVLIGAEKLADLQSEFTALPEDTGETTEPDQEDNSWLSKLEVDKNKKYYSTIDNLALMLTYDSVFKGNISYDEFEQRPIFKRNLPWRKVAQISRYLTDRDADNIEHYLEKRYNVSTSKIEKALSVIYERNSFHPVKDYLDKQSWDGEERVDTLLIDYMGAEDTPYTRAVTRKTLVAAVARVNRPGVKFDHVLTLIGDEGKGKSTLIKKLGRVWFSDTFNLHMLQSKEAYEQIRGAWIIEIAELAGMAKAEIERVKGFISAAEDRYRQAYGHRVENFPRQCIFIGTTNKPDFLLSQTGNRRFWPIVVDLSSASKSVFTDLSEYEVNQIWAEAVQLHGQGEALHLPANLEADAVSKQREHTEEHPWTGIIKDFLDRKLPEDWDKRGRYEKLEWFSEDPLQAEGSVWRDRVCVSELWEIGLKKREVISSWEANTIRNIMRNMDGWKEEQKALRYGLYGLQRRGYFRTENREKECYKGVTRCYNL